MKLEQAARQALEALEQWKEHDAWHKRNDWNDEDESAITALREALAEQAAEPSGRCKWCLAYNGHLDFCPALAEQAEQEPVAWGMRASNGAFFTITPEEHDNNGEGLHNIPLYAAPVSIESAVLAEREACATVCENLPTPKDATTLTHIPTLETCAAAIRARGGK